MPIFDFQCQQCTEVFEVMCKSTDKAQPCPHCGSNQVKKLLSAPAIHGEMAKGRDVAMQSLTTGKGCSCGATHHCH